ncbi:putative phosphotransferase [Serinicoccus hydrothermalis]|uniref:Putative phosphotransferase n=1 Tax=Serinicoccus hydrothermalis TaxID=1758689 RepID=A0A1B1N9I1_9MICO|nr:phosphotransferase family protein [Serinicoccus hydrothermalis]ANS78087.1 putative phosphotransferase [Serinicoccus hydrothermalis]
MSTSTPDGSDVVVTPEEAQELEHPPLLVLDPVTAWLDVRGLGEGPLSWERIGDGQSNVTFLLRRGERRLVLRRGPRPPLPPSTHDMVREARIQQVLGAHDVRVPRILAVEEGTDVLGVPFYVMEHLDAEVVTDTQPGALADDPAARAAASAGVVDTLVSLHTVDVSAEDVAALGRPEGYLERQVRRFTDLWPQVSTRELPGFDPLATWLDEHRPTRSAHAVVHGDFRLGNLMLDPTHPGRVVAILDWEMATLGDPLADLGYLTATWSDRHGAWPATVMDHSPVTVQEGWWDRDELAQRYAAATGADISHLPWYRALALWKAAVFCEAIRTRWLRGERPGDQRFAPMLEEGVPELLRQAQEHSRQL